MKISEIIMKKRDGGVLTKEEIQFFIDGIVSGSIADYQASALLMAIYIRGMNEEETSNLTMSMRDSGDVIDLSPIKGIKVDKHSTGGVGDKTTFIIAPIVAACKVPVAKMSGRGLGFTGGTVDKMESIPGFRTSLEKEEFINQVNEIGISVIGQTGHIAPADKILYALRDVTATVDNFSLISGSIMSKKLAAGSDKIVLDVKCGDGAFMEDEERAKALGTMMCKIGEAAGKHTVAVITDMNQPLGYNVGNSLEIIEAIDVLKGKGPKDITELAISLSAIMLKLGEMVDSVEEGRMMATEAITSGKALAKVKEFIAAQGGNPDVVDDYSLFPEPQASIEVTAKNDGYISQIHCKCIGLASQSTGAGREKKEDALDLSAGIKLAKKLGDSVKKGDLLATIYGDKSKIEVAAKQVEDAFEISDEKVEIPKLIKEIIGL